MPTYTGTLSNGSANYITFGSAVDSGITIPSTEYITKIDFPSGNAPQWACSGSGSFSIVLYARNSNGSSNGSWSGQSTALSTISLSTSGHTTNYKSWSLAANEGTKYSGTRLYFQATGNTTNIRLTNAPVTVTVTTAYRYTKVVAGNPIKKTDLT